MYNYKKEQLKGLIQSIDHIQDSYILDDENAIILLNNIGRDLEKGDPSYIMIHERLIDDKLVEINKWYQKCYYFGPIQEASWMKDLNLFMVQNGCGDFGSIYDYKKGEFIVPVGDWNFIYPGYKNKYIKEYNGFLGQFSINSTCEDDDVYSYQNSVTGEKIVESFAIRDGNYYALLNVDGTIRGNKLFKGKSFSKITEIIDLNQYESLAEFKKIRKQICDEMKKKNKDNYYQMLKAKNNGSISPYLDSEVAKILELKK